MIYFFCYLALINLIAALTAVIDKHKAKKGLYRISEKALFILALLGGAAGEYGAMRLVHHKTLHKRFMIGLPVIILLQAALISGILYII